MTMMMTMDVFDTVGMCFVIAVAIVCTESRQMCYTCQFQSSAEAYYQADGRECVTAPLNWTGGEIRMKCPDRCIITAMFDKKTLNPTFFFRGCQKTDRKDGCTETSAWHDCFYSCGDGNDYCNDYTSFKILEDNGLDDDKKKKEKEKNKKKDDDTKDDMAASLYCLIGLVGVCAVGYFVKKKYCTEPEDEDEEEAAVS